MTWLREIEKYIQGNKITYDAILEKEKSRSKIQEMKFQEKEKKENRQKIQKRTDLRQESERRTLAEKENLMGMGKEMGNAYSKKGVIRIKDGINNLS